jgi:hypothetical protein
MNKAEDEEGRRKKKMMREKKLDLVGMKFWYLL